MRAKLPTDEELEFLFTDILKENNISGLNKKDRDLNYKSFKKLTSKKLPYIYNIDHFCSMSNSSSKQISLFLAKKNKAYRTFNLPKKSGGFREINAPSKKLKYVQRWILDNILFGLNAGKHAHGFVPGKSIVTNASIHVGQSLILGIDIKDFFPNINFTSVYDVFKSTGYTQKVAFLLADLCTYQNALPQGAPTSPMLANLVAVKLDKKIVDYCNRRNLQYTRYADDITISGSDKLPRYKDKIIEIIEDNGFIVNIKKTRVLSRGSRQKVTGLIVNDKISIGRIKKKNLRAIVHNIFLNGPEKENRNKDPFFKEKIFGELAFAKMIDSNFANPLITKLKTVDWDNYNKKIAELREGELQIRSLEKKSYVEPKASNQTINSEGDFLQAISDTIGELKCFIEDKRWIQPFWNDARKVMLDGKEHHIPAYPKRETSIQPTLHIFFDRRLIPLGIHTIRESDEGVGKLDFKFLITIKGIPFNVCTEFKIAHNYKLEQGLNIQLPLYLKACNSNSGIFLVMWFKDEKGNYFKEPTNKSKSEMIKYLETTVKEINKKEEFKIQSILIDASKKPSASYS